MKPPQLIQLGELDPEQFSFCGACSVPPPAAPTTSSLELNPPPSNNGNSNSSSPHTDEPIDAYEEFHTPKQQQQQQHRLHISGMCCSSEVPSVRQILNSFHCHNIRFNIVQRTVYFECDATKLKPIQEAFHRAGFPSTHATKRSHVAENDEFPLRNNNDDNDKSSVNGVPSPPQDLSVIPYNVICSGLFWLVSLVGDFLQYRPLLLFGIGAVLFGLPPIVVKAYQTIRRKRFDANVMMVIAAFGSVVLGEFQEAGSVAFLFSISEHLEHRASARARRALEQLLQLQPNHAIRLDSDNMPERVDMENIQINDILLVRVGDKVAADGRVVRNSQTSLDCSSLTGESIPIHVSEKDTVQAGSINVGEHVLYVQVTSTPSDSTVARLVQLVETAQTHQSETSKLVDRFAQSYTPVVVCVAFLLATLSWVFGVQNGLYWTRNALILIVIACPCALTISTPVTYAAGLAACAQHGVICKTPETLELLGSVDTVVVDKTGTLTQGKFKVTEIRCLNDENTAETLELLGLLEAPSSHPLSTALVDYVKKEGVVLNKMVTDHETLPGEGVTGIVRGRRVFVGNQKLFERISMYDQLPLATRQLTETWHGTIGYVGIENRGIVGCYCLADVVRPEAREAIASLQNDGKTVFMLTGDSNSAAMAVAKELGLPESNIRSSLLPEDKLHFVGSLKTPDSSLLKKSSKVLFCGDGVNDVPVMSAAADVGVSMGEGAAAALEMSDVTLMNNNLSKLVYVTRMGRRVLATVKENIFLSLFCKLLVVCLTFAGFMTLFYAIASDVGVMLLVTLNGMKLLPRESKPGTNFCLRFRYDLVPTREQSRPSNPQVSAELV